jgi:hypothetical protein
MRVKLNKKVICADGFSVSVQANEGAYCTPRQDSAEQYTEVELGFPSAPEELIMDWIESYGDPPPDPTGAVYPYVPVSVVTNVIAKHGGIVSGEVPPGIPRLEAISGKFKIPSG